MCGICGIVTKPGAGAPDAARLQTMIASLRHRGPDGEGMTVSGNVALGHTRLAIIDLPGADQPFFAHDATLIANGEVYNYRELRAGMHGVNFVSSGDCEPPLHLWAADRVGWAAVLRGMYGIAINDRRDESLTLTRDPFGIKPLYVAETDAGLAFASEPAALLAAGFGARAVDPAVRAALLRRQYSGGAQTIFGGIARVLPGETITVSGGTIAARTRRDALPAGAIEDISEADALSRLDRALMESVDLHQRSDVPYGMFLSGGIDSSAVLACMARLNAHPLAFTAGFDVTGAADEREHAAAVARAVGARHETILVTEADFFAHLPAIAACMDDPAADYAIIPTWLLARRARQDVKVVLSGEGGDELLAGYGRYRKAMRPWWLGGRRMRGRGVFDGLGVLRAGVDALPIAARRNAPAANGLSRLQVAQEEDIADWLPNDLLLKLDRCLMAHAVEGRTPFLDQGVASAVWRLPDSLKIRNGQGKYLLRAWLAEHLPAARPFAPKQGFTVPVGTWIARHGACLGPLVAARPAIAEIAHPDRVRTLFARAADRRAGTACWILLFYALWHRAHIENATDAASPVYDALG
jgi:asparagine synthase (glutamine-hydrolysing)